MERERIVGREVKEISYDMHEHHIKFSLNGQYYCRALHAVLPGNTRICNECPLHFATESEGDICRYYIPRGESEEDAWTPDEQMELVSKWIDRNVDEVFPLYEENSNPGRLLIEQALRFAARAHFGGLRKGNKIPYISHPIEVMMLTSRMTRDCDVIAAAALHDVVEDTPATIDDIRLNFGERVASFVRMESENKRDDLPREATWKIRKKENLLREKNAPIEAKQIMLADKVSNMRATVRDFREEGKNIWQKFNMKDESEQAWYYRSVANVLKDLSNEELYIEYTAMLEEVFFGVVSPELVDF
ncbi:MAG: HD domain-containing protein [Lachnospiraceae bacterium]|nr:HD domain-containing protein [Lachnospiraceae bacterium]